LTESKSGDSAIAPFINAVIDRFPSTIESRYGRNSITPLHLAAAFGNVTAVKVLLHRGAGPFARNGNGHIPIESIDDDDEELLDKDGNVVVGLVRQRSYRRWRDTREVLRRAMEPRCGQ
jgi:hypothetical protein